MPSLPDRQNAAWRDPAQIISQWEDAPNIDQQILSYRVAGDWWETLARMNITLFVTREYEHVVLAMRADKAGPQLSYMCMPHPSGLVVDQPRGTIYIASTRNPNQLYDLMPVARLLPQLEQDNEQLEARPLVPARTRFYPGALYLHDLAVIGDRLYANAVGQNAIVRLDSGGNYEWVWWPRCIETEDGPDFGHNYIQLNSIAAGADLSTSFFSASSDRISKRRPGHQNFAVDRRGVIFSGATREVVVDGLTRPHSARLYDQRLWVDNSGYGEFGMVEDGAFSPVVRLPGWTRGLCFHEEVAFVGTSRVIPRFQQYAPGLTVDASVCGIHAIDLTSGRILGHILWPKGNQIFAIDWANTSFTTGFPFSWGRKRSTRREKRLFYAFHLASS